MRDRLAVVMTALLGMTCGCVGVIGGDESANGGNGGAGGAAAEDGGGGGLATLPLPRLTATEYTATLRDVLRAAVPAIADEVYTGLAPTLRGLPADQLVGAKNDKHGGSARLDQSQQQGYADVPFLVAANVGRAVTSSPERVAMLVGSCVTASDAVGTKQCLDAFVRRFGELVLRRPPSDDDVAFYLTSTQTATAVEASTVAEIVTVLLSSPRFLYHVESGDQTTSPSTFRLDAWELASRLSYHFWGTMPDAELRDAARSGALLDDATYAREVARLFTDPRTDATMRAFFREWFWPLLELPPLESRVGDPVFDAFAGANRPGPTLRAHMVDEVLDAASFVVGHGGSVADLMTNTQAFARDADLAAIYGVAPWDGKATPAQMPPERVGLLSRAAFLATGTANTRPIMKGVFIRTTLLCDDVPPPPPNAANTHIDLSPNLTTREVVEQLTQQPGTSCAGCHATLLNPLGFASEGFDALGRKRITQRLFDDRGNLVTEKPVDTSSVPAVLPGDTRPSNGLADVTQRLVESGKVEACFARRYFRYAFRTLEDRQRDAAVLDALTTLARSGRPLSEALTLVALRPEWKQRLITP